MLTDRKTLEKNLKITINNYKHDRNVIDVVQDELNEYGLLEGETQKIFIGRISLEQMNKNLLALFTKGLYAATNENLVNPKDYFTPEEIKKAITESSFTPARNNESFPVIIDNVIELTPQDYLTKINMHDVVKLYNNGLIDYDFRSQRNAKIINKNGVSYQTPNINKNSVEQIKNKILSGTYYADPITLNMILGSNGDGDELTYDVKNNKLYLNGGNLHILDGFHRLNAFVLAVLENPDIKLEIPVIIKNYDIESAAEYFGQINTINTVDPSHLKSLKSERYGDLVAKQLIEKSDLRGRVSQSKDIRNKDTELTTYLTLSDTIDEEFELNSNRDALLLSNYLKEFFDMLIGSYEKEFISDVKRIRKVSLINSNMMFAGYIVLARRFKEKNISVEYLLDVLHNIDFSKENPLWEEIGVLNNGYTSRMAKKQIKKYFNEINLDEVKKDV